MKNTIHNFLGFLVVNRNDVEKFCGQIIPLLFIFGDSTSRSVVCLTCILDIVVEDEEMWLVDCP